jgi:hypothetical protein
VTGFPEFPNSVHHKERENVMTANLRDHDLNGEDTEDAPRGLERTAEMEKMTFGGRQRAGQNRIELGNMSYLQIYHTINGIILHTTTWWYGAP